ncbi:MAG TPA: ATP-binding cassette domain-containing protein, partial [Chitinophagales bacterium]|nr:ATP-binding cassette domain-containing protein [Chitinophagales bacterium]
MLSIKNLNVAIGDKQILKDFNLEIKPGEIHAIMGPNGTGKSTLASTLAGKEDYEVQSGEVIFKGKQLLEMSADERAREGVFLAFQYPLEIPDVSATSIIKAAVNGKRKHE